MHRLNCLLRFLANVLTEMRKMCIGSRPSILVNAFLHASGIWFYSYSYWNISYSRRNSHVIFWINSFETKHQSIDANLVHSFWATGIIWMPFIIFDTLKINYFAEWEHTWNAFQQFMLLNFFAFQFQFIVQGQCYSSYMV